MGYSHCIPGNAIRYDSTSYTGKSCAILTLVVMTRLHYYYAVVKLGDETP